MRDGATTGGRSGPPRGPQLPGSEAALKALEAAGCTPDEGAEVLPRGRGLYAVYCTQQAWKDLGLVSPGDARPLYVGKAEVSVSGRELGTHFGVGRTGSSTFFRRSLAALLRDRLQLRAIPRNLAKPADFTKYALSDADDRKLTTWMRNSLRLTGWPAPPGVMLSSLEKQAVKWLKPPLNLTYVKTPWTAHVKVARKRMADEACGWRPKA